MGNCCFMKLNACNLGKLRNVVTSNEIEEVIFEVLLGEKSL